MDENNCVETSCPSCGLMIFFKNDTAAKIRCKRCHTKITTLNFGNVERCLILSLTSLILFFPSVSFPFLKVSINDYKSECSIIDCIQILYSENHLFLALVTFLTAVFFPVMYLLFVMYVSFSLKVKRKLAYTKEALRIIDLLKSWHMIEIFLAGVLVSLVKLVGMFHLDFGVGFYLILALTSLVLGIQFVYDKMTFWSIWSRYE